MSTELVRYTPQEIRAMAEAVVKSQLFPGIRSPEAAMTLMLLCQAEGLHPIQATRRYHIIQGQPSLKADAMLGEFQKRGGKVKWVRCDHDACEATFTAPGVEGPTSVSWTVDDAKRAGLTAKQTWQAFPRQMLRARVISEGIRMCMPEVNVGIYTPEEVQDFDARPAGMAVEQAERVEAEVVEHAAPHMAEAHAPAVDSEGEDVSAERMVREAAENRKRLQAELGESSQQASPLFDPEAIALQVASKIEAEKKKPEKCDKPGCVAPVYEYEDKQGGRYWACHGAKMEYKNAIDRGETPAQAKAHGKGHFFRKLPRPTRATLES